MWRAAAELGEASPLLQRRVALRRRCSSVRVDDDRELMCLNTQRRYERVVLTYRALWWPRQRLQRQGGGAAAGVAAARAGRLWRSRTRCSATRRMRRADEASSGGDAAADSYEVRSNYIQRASRGAFGEPEFRCAGAANGIQKADCAFV